MRKMRGTGADGKSTECPDDSQRIRWPKKILFGELVNEGNPGKGRPPFKWINSLSNYLERVGSRIE